MVFKGSQDTLTLPTPPPLTSVALVFRAKGVHDALVLDTTTAFLDVGLELALHDACKLNSVALMQRIWDSCLPESEPSPANFGPGSGGTWSRRKYLRTDKHYRRYQFRRSIIEAVEIKGEQDAVKMTKWLFAHFHGCIVPFGAVQEAAGAGRLEILQFFKEHEVPPRADGGSAMRDEIDVKEGNVVRWGRHDMAWASFCKHDHVVHWLHENTRAPRWMKSVLVNVAYNGDIELMEWLRENYRTHDRSLVEEDEAMGDNEAEDDDPPPLIEAEDVQPPPDNISPEDFLHVDLRAVAEGPRMAGRIIEQLMLMGVQPFIRVDPTALRQMAGEEVPALGELLGREAATTRPAAETEQQHNSVAGNRLARAIMGRGADALTQEDPEMFNRGNIDEAVDTALLVEEIIRSGLPLDISIDLREQRDRVRQLLTNLAAADVGEDPDIEMADPDDEMDGLGEEESQAGIPVVRLLLRGMAGGPAAARRLMDEAEVNQPEPAEPLRQRAEQFFLDREGDLEGENAGELLRGDPFKFMRMAICGDQHEMMEWLFTNGYVRDCYLNVWVAIDNHRLEMLEWLIEHKLLEAGRALEAAARRGRLDTAKHLYDRYWQNIRAQRHYPLTKSPEDETSRFAMNSPLWICEETISSAVQCGNLELVQWLFTTFNSDVDLLGAGPVRGWAGMSRPHLIDDAASRSLPMVKYLHEISVSGSVSGLGPTCTAAAMDQAAGSYRLDVVKWLNDHRSEGCTTDAMDAAASNGHLEMVQWLHMNRSEGCTQAAMNGAAAKGHLDVLEWLHENRSEGCSTAAMDAAAAKGVLDVIKWLDTNRSEGCTTSAMDSAASGGYLNVVKWLDANRSEGCTSSAMDSAASSGHVDVVKWLSEYRSEGCTTKAMDGAALAGHLDVVKWLHEHRTEGCTVQAMNSAAGRDDLDMVQWLNDHRSEGCTTAAMDSAAAGWNGNFDMMLFLHSQRSEGCTTGIFDGTKKPDLLMDIHESDRDYTCDNIHDWLVEHYAHRIPA